MMKSMTGYGKSQGTTPLGVVTVELISVNHKALDIRLRLPEICRFLEIPLRNLIKASLKRGHVDGYIRIEKDETALSRDIVLSFPAARAYYDEAIKFCKAIGLPSLDGISWIFMKAEAWQSPETPETEEIEQAVVPTFREALERLNASRETEGANLEDFFKKKLEEIDPVLDEIENLKSKLMHHVKETLEQRLKELALDPSVNPDRLAQEIAYLAQRADITEEISRLRSHLSSFREKIRSTETSGRELDFILQEMHREANTIGSKSVSYELTSQVIRLKELFNQMREQVQNVE